MGFKLAVLLCLSFALVAHGQIGTAIVNDLNAKENQLNCLLGKPSCGSPPPPGNGTSAPPSSETPAPGPGQAVTGTADAVISISFPDNFVVTDDVRNRLVGLIQQELGPNVVVQLQPPTGGRKLLQLTSLIIRITGITDCGAIGLRLQAFIPGRFVQLAVQINIPVQSATLNAFVCSVPGSPVFTLANPPAQSPSPSGGPSSGGPSSEGPSSEGPSSEGPSSEGPTPSPGPGPSA